jgi:hypothetical protein
MDDQAARLVDDRGRPRVLSRRPGRWLAVINQVVQAYAPDPYGRVMISSRCPEGSGK